MSKVMLGSRSNTLNMNKLLETWVKYYDLDEAAYRVTKYSTGNSMEGNKIYSRFETTIQKIHAPNATNESVAADRRCYYWN